MALTQITTERTYSYSHNVGMLTAFSGPVDMALGEPGQIFVSCRAERAGISSRPRSGLGTLEPGRRYADSERALPKHRRARNRLALRPRSGQLDKAAASCKPTNGATVFPPIPPKANTWAAGGLPALLPGQLDGPSGMRFDPEGNLVIAESRNNRIQRFDREGRHLETWGEAGSGPGQLDMPYGIHVANDGSVYVADWGNDRVQKFATDGELLAIFGASATGVGSLTRPSGVAVDPDGDVYVADCGNNRVQIYSAGGEYITGLYGDARTLSKSAQQYVDVNPNMAKARMRADTSKEWRFFRPTAVAVDSNDMILIAEAIPGRIQFYEKDTDYMDPQFNL